MKHALLCFTLFLLAGCEESTPPVAKVVADKASPTEGGLSPVMIGNKMGWTETAETRYYLVAEDGTVAKVGMSEWYKARVGTSFPAYWYEKR